MTFATALNKAASKTLRKLGSAVTFTQAIPGTYDAATDVFTSPSTVTVTGYAARVEGNPKTYEALKLVQSENPTLEFVPDTFGSLPALGSSVTFGSVVYTVRDIEPRAPTGTAIAARIVVAR